MARHPVFVLIVLAVVAVSCSDDNRCPVNYDLYQPELVQHYSLGILREVWTIASPPVDPVTGLHRPTRGFHDPALIWYNPYVQFRITDIYDREIENQSDDRTHVLVLKHDPAKSILRPPDSVTTNRDVWTGIMRGLPRGIWDQSRTEFLELRMAVRPGGAVSDLGKLHIDLGRMIEDVDGNGEWNTEDLERHGTRNGILEDGEDVGLDGIPDEDEVSPDGSGYDPVTNPDPAGDNWKFDNSRPSELSGINGTEGNSAEYLGGRPDSEDLGGENTPGLDRLDSYYSLAVDLANPGDALVPGSDKQDDHNNLTWNTYRLLLWEEFADAVVGYPDSSRGIQFARLWLDNAESAMQVYIARIDLVIDLRDDDTLSVYPQR